MSEPEAQIHQLSEVVAELERRKRAPQRAATEAEMDPAYVVLLADAVNRLAQHVADMPQHTEPVLRIRRIERDTNGNIVRIVEERADG